MKISFAPKKKAEDFEQAKITSIDKISGRVGIFLRNGLVSSATYLYDINDLRVGASVLVGRVSNTYVIMNKVPNMPRAGVSYSLPRPVVPSTFTWSDDFSYADGPLPLDKWFYSYSFPTPVIVSGEVRAPLEVVGNVSLGASCLAIISDYFSVSIKTRIFEPSMTWGTLGLLLGVYPYNAHNIVYIYVDNFEPRVVWRGPNIGPPDYFHKVIASVPRGDIWLKITKTGGNIQGLYSLDGVNWTFLGSDSVWTGQNAVSFINTGYGSAAVNGGVLDDFTFLDGEPAEFPKAEWSNLFWGQAE